MFLSCLGTLCKLLAICMHVAGQASAGIQRATSWHLVLPRAWLFNCGLSLMAALHRQTICSRQMRLLPHLLPRRPAGPFGPPSCCSSHFVAVAAE